MPKSNSTLAGPKPRQGKSTRLRTTQASIRNVAEFSPIPCGCLCGEQFTPTRRNQKFIPGHRFRSYKTHSCPDCGIVHRMKAGYEE